MKKGFTLIEMIVAIGLFALLMTTTTMLLFASLRSTKKASNVTKAKAEGAYALNLMINLLRYATKINDICRYSVPYNDSVGYSTFFAIDQGSISSSSGLLISRPNRDITWGTGSCSLQTYPFYCPGNEVDICFEIDGIPFQSQVVLRNAQ